METEYTMGICYVCYQNKVIFKDNGFGATVCENCELFMQEAIEKNIHPNTDEEIASYFQGGCL